MAAEKYRELFPYYEYNFTEAVSYAVTACNLNFILRKEQMQALYEYTRGRDVVVNLPTGYGKSICYCLCPLICDSLRGVTSKEH
jgi:superfamily II DNA or RNA helicase